jgi:hypothetical protein
MAGVTEKAFIEELANPHSWLITADNLHSQAIALHERHGRGSIIFMTRDGRRTTWDETNRAVFLLGGFALENALKAFLVYENPEWVSNGRLSRKLRSHSLTDLQRQTKDVPYKKSLLWVLREFEEGLDSWARYPCGLDASRSGHQTVLTEKVWNGYLRLMAAYGKRLRTLLRREWRGPNGFHARWYIDAEFLART